MKNVIQQIFSDMHSWKVEDSHPDVRGMTTPRVRRFLNQLVAHLPTNESYFEVGVHMGGTLIPALAGHKEVDATAVDNWSQFARLSDGHARDFFYQNLSKHQPTLPKIRIVDDNVWTFLKKPEFRNPVGIMFYDGDHKEEDQRRIISAIYPYLAKESVLIIDDYDHPPAKAGTESGMKDVQWLTVDFTEKKGTSGFHNGLGVFHVTKP